MSEVERKHAIVLSGGSAYGAYEVGVIKALFTGKSPTTGFKPLVPEIFTGTSVGAYNGTFLVSRLADGPARAAEELEETWLERVAGGFGTCGNGIYRIRPNPFEFADPACYVPNPLEPFVTAAQDAVFYAGQIAARTVSAMRSSGPLLARAADEIYVGAVFDTNPFRELLRETINFEVVARSPTLLRIFATNWNKGTIREFANTGRADPVDALGVQASAAFPNVFPPTKIGGEFFVDGGLLINTPLKPAIDSGADVLHVIFLDPLVQNIPLEFPLSTLAETFRVYAIFFAAQVRNQILQINALNRLLVPATQGAVTRRDARSILEVASNILRRVQPPIEQRTIEVYCYRPSPEVLRGLLGFLDFERPYIEELIAAGFHDAVHHSPEPDTGARVVLKQNF